MATITIDINLDEKCKRCKKGGATPSGYCLKCITKMIQSGELDHILAPAKKRLTDAIAEATGGQKETPGPLFEVAEFEHRPE